MNKLRLIYFNHKYLVELKFLIILSVLFHKFSNLFENIIINSEILRIDELSNSYY